MPIIQVRDVPEETHRRLKVRAAQQGRTLSALVREELERMAAQPTWAEMRERIRSRELGALEIDPAEEVRATRAERDAELDRP